MRHTPNASSAGRAHIIGRLAITAFTGLALVVVGSGVAQAATNVPLGTANSFSVLAGAGVTATGPSTLGGDLGTYPTTDITGSGSITVLGTNHGGDGVTQGAKDDLVAAYDNAAAQGPTSPISADLAGQLLVPGVYNQAATMQLSGALTLDGEGDRNAVWVFQAGSDLVIGSGATVVLTNGARACNIYWQVTSSASLGTGASFRGTIIALTSITMATGATLDGRALARNGSVTLDTNVISGPACASAPPDGGVDTGDGSAALSTSEAPLLAQLPLAIVVAGGLGVVLVAGARARRRVDA